MNAAREAWFEGQLYLDPERIVFIDETAANTKMARLYGRPPKGERRRAAVPHGHWKTTTFTAALRHEGMAARMVLGGPMNGDSFLAYVEQALVPEPRPGDVIITERPSYALLRGSIHGCSVFAPKVLFQRIGLFDEPLRTKQNCDLWRRSFRQFTFLHMPEVLIESRWHDEQGSKKIDHILEATQLWKRVIDDIPVNDQEAWEGSSHRFLSAMAEFLRVS